MHKQFIIYFSQVGSLKFNTLKLQNNFLSILLITIIFYTCCDMLFSVKLYVQFNSIVVCFLRVHFATHQTNSMHSSRVCPDRAKNTVILSRYRRAFSIKPRCSLWPRSCTSAMGFPAFRERAVCLIWPVGKNEKMKKFQRISPERICSMMWKGLLAIVDTKPFRQGLLLWRSSIR